jgi:predicted DNA-binding transcriptional regulator AlpA
MSIASTGRSKVTRKLTTRMLCERYSITDRTVDRWTASGILPQPMRINNVRYWDEAEVEQRERQRMSAEHQPETAA